MSRDYKPKTKKANRGHPFLSGLLFGFLLGVISAVALTIYLKGDTSPFESKNINAPTIPTITEGAGTNNNPDAKQPETKEDDLDFYTILPETESTVSVKEINDADIKVKKESYFLQVGSFKKQTDADNLKAKLALQGFEAIVQTANLPDKGTWHRVRVGPLNNIKTINKVRSDLTANNFNADLIKINNN